VELEALLEDVGPGAGDLWDIARGALFMQMTSVSFWKIVAGCAAAGTLAAGIVASTLPNRYISTAVIRIKPAPQAAAGSTDTLSHLQQFTLSRNRDIRIRSIHKSGAPAFAVEFADENPAAAQSTVRVIVSSLIEQNLQASRGSGNGATLMEVLDPASLPSRPASPNRVKAMINGLLTGLLVGLLCGAIYSIVRRKQRLPLSTSPSRS
jgi:hypothetical protein